MQRILLLNFGSLGDLHPFIGLALILKKAGYQVSLGTNQAHVPRVLAAGIESHAIGPALNPNDPELIRVVMNPIRGPELLHRKYIFPSTEKSIQDALPLAQESDLIITGILGYFIPTLSEITGVPWAMAMLSPIGYWSAYDPPEIPSLPFLRSLSFMGPQFVRAIYRSIFYLSSFWSAPLQEARKKRGLKKQANPLLPSTMTSGSLNFALFSKYFAEPQADWPKNLIQAGFIEYDVTEGSLPLKNDLETFLNSGDAPIFLTLGSTNVHVPGRIYETFAESIKKLNKRALMSVSAIDLKEAKEKYENPQLHVTDYVPYGRVMPRCSVVVHQGGVGTTGQTLRAGRPAIVLGSVNDQLDNGRHVEKIGAGIKLPLKELSVERLQEAIEKASSESFRLRAQEIAVKMKEEDATEIIVKAINNFFKNK